MKHKSYWTDARAISRELRVRFPGRRFRVKAQDGCGPFHITTPDDVDLSSVRRVVRQWYRDAYGATVKFGRITRI